MAPVLGAGFLPRVINFMPAGSSSSVGSLSCSLLRVASKSFVAGIRVFPKATYTAAKIASKTLPPLQDMTYTSTWISQNLA